MSRPSTAAKSALALRSLSEDQEPPPLARLTPAVGLPLLSTAVTKRTPPVARAANSLAAAELNGLLVVESSANRKVPAWAAWTTAFVPAAKLLAPAAVLLVPPPTVAPPPLAVLPRPPPTVAEAPPAVLLAPPPTVASSPLAALPWPPPTVAWLPP